MLTYIQTVLGPIAAASVGRILHHEHLLSLVPGPWLAGGKSRSTDEDMIDEAVRALSGLKDLGYDLVADLSPYDVVGRSRDGQNVTMLRDISERSGVHIVAGSSVYLEAYSPTWTREATLDQLTKRFTSDVTSGIGSSEIRAGILGEQATGLDEITPHEDKCLRAATRAHVDTGASLVTHTTHGTMALEQLAIMREEGADLSRVVIGHMDIQPDLDYLLEVLDSGVNIAFDTIGKQYWDFVLEPLPTNLPDGEFAKRAYFRSDQRRAERLVELVDRGYVDHLMLSLDLTGAEVYLNPATHGGWGYSYLGASFLPLAISLGLDRSHADTLVRDNPLRLLSQVTS